MLLARKHTHTQNHTRINSLAHRSIGSRESEREQEKIVNIANKPKSLGFVQKKIERERDRKKFNYST